MVFLTSYNAHFKWDLPLLPSFGGDLPEDGHPKAIICRRNTIN
jgi:hypothetical protein